MAPFALYFSYQLVGAAAAVYGLRLFLALVFGVGPIGPIACGLFALLQHYGITLSFLQSFLMTGPTWLVKIILGLFGARAGAYVEERAAATKQQKRSSKQTALASKL